MSRLESQADSEQERKNTAFCPLIDLFRRNILAYKPDFARTSQYNADCPSVHNQALELTCTVRSHQKHASLSFTYGQIHAMNGFLYLQHQTYKSFTFNICLFNIFMPPTCFFSIHNYAVLLCCYFLCYLYLFIENGPSQPQSASVILSR